MPVGKETPLQLLPIKGVRIGTAMAGLRQIERDDITVFELDASSTVAAVFTKNVFCAAPVQVAKQHLSESTPHLLLINSGNANAGLGETGLHDAANCCEKLAKLHGVNANQVLPFSTGVIGEALPVDKLVASLPVAIENLSEDNWLAASKAIMTTDTRPKGCTRTVELDGEVISITGISKGSGMIEPNMATMLAYIATDMPITNDILKTALKHAADVSFNAISVDGDTSTNDAVVLVATGQAPVDLLQEVSDARYEPFLSTLIEVFQHLSEAIVRDGEGATKIINIKVEQAASIEDARVVAYTIARSPLVKTAFFASDPNWGRILAAIGRASVDSLDVSSVNIFLGDVCIVNAGQRAAHYTEASGVQVMSKDEVTVRVVLSQGDCSASVLTCDLSYDYVKINAEYRT